MNKILSHNYSEQWCIENPIKILSVFSGFWIRPRAKYWVCLMFYLKNYSQYDRVTRTTVYIRINTIYEHYLLFILFQNSMYFVKYQNSILFKTRQYHKDLCINNSILYHNVWTWLKKRINQCCIYIPPENVRIPKVFWRF